MKQGFLFVLIVSALLMTVKSYSQEAEDSLIRKLENAEREAILKRDTMQLHRLMSKNIIVQNPENVIVGFRQIMDRIRNGKINYSRFERRIDSVAIVNNIAIVMGLETLTPKTEPPSEKIIYRRFANIWTKESGEWKLTARQATIVSE